MIYNNKLCLLIHNYCIYKLPSSVLELQKIKTRYSWQYFPLLACMLGHVIVIIDGVKSNNITSVQIYCGSLLFLKEEDMYVANFFEIIAHDWKRTLQVTHSFHCFVNKLDTRSPSKFNAYFMLCICIVPYI